MLVLSRKPGEWITVGDNVRLQVVAVVGDRVKLGFEAPRDVAIHRSEVKARIDREGDNRDQGKAA